MDELDLRNQQHPICPACGYDLVGSIEGEHGICPECGEPFQSRRLRRLAREPGWTFASGLRRGVRMVLRRTALFSVVWIAVLVVAAFVVRGLADTGNVFAVALVGVIGFGLTFGGGSIGWMVARDWEAQTGIRGVTVAAALSVWSWLVIGLSVGLMMQLGLLTDTAAFLGLVACATSTLLVIHGIFLND